MSKAEDRSAIRTQGGDPQRSSSDEDIAADGGADPRATLAAARQRTLSPLVSWGLRAARTTDSVVARRGQIEAVTRELDAARDGLSCVAFEGEPGIGKTRLLLAVEELARTQGFVAVGVTADEEIRGPFLLARSLLAAPPLLEAAERTRTEPQFRQVVDALGSPGADGFENLAPDQQLLRTFDLVAVALARLAGRQPLALLIDDLQWADDDSLRLLRFVARSDVRSPIFMAFAGRGEELAVSPSATSLLADLERMGVLRRIALPRLTQAESTELLQRLLAGPIQIQSAAVMHAQAEGVPFVLHEQVRAYRDSGLIQQIDGVWTLSRNAERLLPSAVRTLIQRREARLPEDTKRLLAEGAVLGRNFSLRDLRSVRLTLGEEAAEAHLARGLAPAIAAGLLIRHAEGAQADYGFTHEQVREFAQGRLTPPERRAVHAAVLDILTAGGEPSEGSLSQVARHAIAAGRIELGARASVDAARVALRAHAPEEALRLVDLAQPIASDPTARIELLRIRDDAYDVLHRPEARLEGLTEMAALAEAIGHPVVESEVMLRRAAALRAAGEREGAAGLARRVREMAAVRDDPKIELAAYLEMGQALLGAGLGEAYSRPPSEADLDGAEAAFQGAREIASRIGDEAGLAASYRELGIIALSRIRQWFIERVGSAEHMDMLRRIASGETAQEVLETLTVAPLAEQTNDYLRQALELYEGIGDRPGAMNTIVAMAVANWALEIHLEGSVRRIEELHRLVARNQSFMNESSRALAEVQMLFGSHVYARAKVFPDVALVKGREAHEAARAMGERAVEFSAAGGLALTHAELGEVAEAEAWVERAAELARTAPSPWRAREIEAWRGMVRAAAGDGSGMRRHLEKAGRLAEEHGRAAHRCEILARLALEAARLGADGADEGLLELAGRTAEEVRQLVSVLPGRPPWGQQARAALARVALAKGDAVTAAQHGRAALRELDEMVREDALLDVVLPAGAAIFSGGSVEEGEEIRSRLGVTLGLITQRITDPDVRVRWFKAPLGRELARLAGPLGASPTPAVAGGSRLRLSDAETDLLRHLVGGRSNGEIAAAMNLSEEEVQRRLAELYVHVGASSRADATANAFIRRMV